METINQRIKILIPALGFSSLNQFDRALGVARNTSAHYCSEGKKPGPDYTEKILNTFTQVDALWLMTGKGDMFFPEKMKREYIEALEKRLEAAERRASRYETMIDMAAQNRNVNFQRLRENAPVREIYTLYRKSSVKVA